MPLNLSMQSTPFGSSVLNTKQLNAVLNSSPQGPCAIPPRHGQSQLISPVSGLNAPSCEASSSSSSGPRGCVAISWDSPISVPRSFVVMASEALMRRSSSAPEVLRVEPRERRDFSGRREGGRSSSLRGVVFGSSEKSVVLGFYCLLASVFENERGGGGDKRTFRLVSEDVGGCIPVYDSAGKGPSRSG